MLIIEHAVAVALEVGVCYLISEFLTDTLVFLGPFKSARTVAASFLKPLLNGCYYIFIFIKGNSRLHKISPFSFCDYIIAYFFLFVCNKVTKLKKVFLI